MTTPAGVGARVRTVATLAWVGGRVGAEVGGRVGDEVGAEVGARVGAVIVTAVGAGRRN
jgi:hypothetical protein